MKKYRYKNIDELKDIVDAKPVCGEDFCDSCGDCLHCHWEDECYGNDMHEHLWVEYLEDSEE